MSSTGLIILGVNRSGTSAIAAALQALGVYFGEKADLPVAGFRLDYDHFENARLVEMFSSIQAEFALGGRSFTGLPHHWATFPDIQDEIKAGGALLNSLFGSKALWGFKDPGATLLLSFVEALLAQVQAQTRYLLAVRHPAAVAAGLGKRQLMPETEALGVWTHYMLTALTETPLDRLRLIPYKDLVNDPAACLQPLWQELSLAEPDWELARGAVKADLNRSNQDAHLPTFTAKLWELVQSLPTSQALDSASPAYQQIEALREEWDEMRRLTSIPVTSAGEIRWRCGHKSGVIGFVGERAWIEAILDIPAESGTHLELSFTNLFDTIYLKSIYDELLPNIKLTVKTGRGAYVDYVPGRVRISPHRADSHTGIELLDPSKPARIHFEFQLEHGLPACNRTAHRLANELASKSST